MAARPSRYASAPAPTTMPASTAGRRSPRPLAPGCPPTTRSSGRSAAGDGAPSPPMWPGRCWRRPGRPASRPPRRDRSSRQPDDPIGQRHLESREQQPDGHVGAEGARPERRPATRAPRYPAIATASNAQLAAACPVASAARLAVTATMATAHPATAPADDARRLPPRCGPIDSGAIRRAAT